MDPSTVETEPLAAAISPGRIYAEQRGQMVGYLQRIVGDHATAEDLLHDTFVKALGAWSTRDATASAQAWLYRIATNTAYDELRRRRRARVASFTAEQVPDLAGPPFEGQVVNGDAVRQALRHVPAVFRAPLLLHAHSGQRVDEIAGQLKITVGTVKSRLHRGRAHFRTAYGALADPHNGRPESNFVPFGRPIV